MNNDGGSGAPGTNWDQLAITGTLDLSNLSPTMTFAINLQSLTGSNASGPLGTFDAYSNHTWMDVITTTDGITGGFNSADFSMNTSGFQNAIGDGQFSFVVDSGNPNAIRLAVHGRDP